MHCPNQNTDLLLAYAASQLDAETTRALEQHLAGCQECRAVVAEQAGVWKALDLWEAPPVSPDFDRRFYTRARDAALPWWERLAAPFRLPIGRAVPLAAAACLLLIAGWILERPVSIAPARTSAEPVRIEQVERTLDDLELLKQFELGGQPDRPHSDTL